MSGTLAHPRGDIGRANRRLAWRLAIVPVLGIAFAYLQPPLYRAFCEWTGIYDIDRADTVSAAPFVPRPVRIEFDANLHDKGLRFEPMQHVSDVRTGDVVQMTYRITNLRDTPVIGQAVPSYGPSHAGQYVKKLDCFCFKQQTFAAHETRELPVVFVLDPKLPDNVGTVTLSYTFFEVPAGHVGKAGTPG